MPHEKLIQGDGVSMLLDDHALEFMLDDSFWIPLPWLESEDKDNG